DARLEGGEWAGLAGGVAVAGAASLAGHDGAIAVALPAGLTVRATPDLEPLQSLPAVLSRLLGGQLAMTLALPRPTLLSLARGTPRLQGELQTTIVRDKTRLDATVKGAGGATDFAGSYELTLATPQLAVGRIKLGDVAADLGGPFNLAGHQVVLRLA